MLKFLILVLIQFALLFPASGWSFRKNKKIRSEEIKPVAEEPEQKMTVPNDLQALINSYPDLKIQAVFNDESKDWILNFNSYGKDFVFYWADGSILPKEELEQKENYKPVIYPYSNILREPSTFTEEEKMQLKEYGKIKNRKKEAGTSMFFFDAVYSAQSRKAIEPHIIGTNFLGKATRVHEKIFVQLKSVEKKILEAEKKSPDVKIFIKELKSAASYHWREIDGTKRKSFHSLGIAIDVLPVAYHGGEVFWSWARDKNPEGWMMTPLKKRWMPPKEIIEAFESEGFIWGGYWAIWDNMHFEYHPEMIGKLN